MSEQRYPEEFKARPKRSSKSSSAATRWPMCRSGWVRVSTVFINVILYGRRRATLSGKVAPSNERHFGSMPAPEMKKPALGGLRNLRCAGKNGFGRASSPMVSTRV
jgi:hypothetical protein